MQPNGWFPWARPMGMHRSYGQHPIGLPWGTHGSLWTRTWDAQGNLRARTWVPVRAHGSPLEPMSLSHGSSWGAHGSPRPTMRELNTVVGAFYNDLRSVLFCIFLPRRAIHLQYPGTLCLGMRHVRTLRSSCSSYCCRLDLYHTLQMWENLTYIYMLLAVHIVAGGE